MLREFLKDHDVYSLLAPKSRRITYPTFADRAVWQKLGRQEQEEILKLGEWGRFPSLSEPYCRSVYGLYPHGQPDHFSESLL